MQNTARKMFKLAVLGAAGGIGQPLSMLLKMNPLVETLKLYDIKGAPGVAADLSHIPTPARVSGYDGDNINECLNGVDLVLISAGIPRKPGMTRDDLLGVNCDIVRKLVHSVGEHAHNAIIGIISNPVNSTVPVAAETLKKLGVYNRDRLFGITTLDLVRSRTFVAEALGRAPDDTVIPVIGGHSGPTIVPILSQYTSLSEEQVKQLTHRIQYGGDEVVKAKAGAGSATLSMAFSAAEWSQSILRALRGDTGVIEYSFVENDVMPGLKYFSCALELGQQGIAKRLPLPELNAYEQSLMEECKVQLKQNIAKGESLVNN